MGVEHPVAREHLALVARSRSTASPAPRRRCTATRPARSSWRWGTRGRARPCGCAVVQRPQLGPLALGVPLAEVVAEAEHALLGAGALLVAAGTAERGVEAVLLDRVEQGRGLQAVARGAGAGLLGDAALVDRVLDGSDDQPLADVGDDAVAELDDLREVVPGVDVHDRERELAGAEGLLGEAQQHDRVLAAAEEQHGALELGGHLTEDVDGLGLEGLEVGQLVVDWIHQRAAWSGVDAIRVRCSWGGGVGGEHSRRDHVDAALGLFLPAQRPSRPSPGWVHGAQPIEA